MRWQVPGTLPRAELTDVEFPDFNDISTVLQRDLNYFGKSSKRTGGGVWRIPTAKMKLEKDRKAAKNI
jgi:hypothetical protein